MKLWMMTVGILLAVSLLAACGKKDSGTKITAEEAVEIAAEGGAVIVDVREQDEYDASHIEGAVLMPHGQTEALAPALLPDKDQPILLYCRSGRRSAIAARALEKLGYTAVYDLGAFTEAAKAFPVGK